jgi:hypothetical protein
MEIILPPAEPALFNTFLLCTISVVDPKLFLFGSSFDVNIGSGMLSKGIP